jgi:hypothetical protein
VIIARPEKCGNAAELFSLADESVILTPDTLRHMIQYVPLEDKPEYQKLRSSFVDADASSQPEIEQQ